VGNYEVTITVREIKVKDDKELNVRFWVNTSMEQEFLEAGETADIYDLYTKYEESFEYEDKTVYRLSNGRILDINARTFHYDKEYARTVWRKYIGYGFK
jgi:hypothetical protein